MSVTVTVVGGDVGWLLVGGGVVGGLGADCGWVWTVGAEGVWG